jgi:hypothetical protein
MSAFASPPIGEIETKDDTYETFAKEIMAKLPLDKVKAAGYDVDLAKVRGY